MSENRPVPPLPPPPPLPENPVQGTSSRSSAVTGTSNLGSGGLFLSVLSTQAGSGRFPGVQGSGVPGVFGVSGDPTSSGVHGENDSGGTGVSGTSHTGTGVSGESDSGGYGVSGSTNSVFQPGPNGVAGVWGNNFGSGTGVKGTSSGGDGVLGFSNAQAHAGVSANNSAGGYGLWASGKPAGHFEGDVEVTGKLTVNGDHHCGGKLTVDVDIVMPASDFAEDFPVEASEGVEPGTVMVLDENGVLRPGDQSYDRKVAGVISGAGNYRPGLILDRHESSLGRLPLALVGKVYCKVDATYGPIEVGHLLTTSPTAGHAMKADNPIMAFGAVIGKALRPLGSGRGLIPILIAMQ
jgi:hypothetical protein